MACCRDNCGEDGAVIASKILDRDEYNWDYDAQAGEFKDPVKAGIVDPTKVVRPALQDAASVAEPIGAHGGDGRGDAGEEGHGDDGVGGGGRVSRLLKGY